MEEPSSSRPSVFHQGDLQSGISLAISQSKLVACFIYTPDEHVSQLWEDYWLANKSHPTDMLSDAPPLGLLLAEKAVLLKLEFGSQEANFLNAFVEVKESPALLIIHNGKVLECLERDVGRAEFETRLKKAAGVDSLKQERVPEGPPTGLNDDEEVANDIGGRSASLDELKEAPETPATTITPEQPPAAQTLLAERARKLEADRLRREAAEKAERIVRATQRKREEEEAARPDKGKGRAQDIQESKEQSQAREAWLYQQKLRKDEAKKERERILAQIENDKQNRKAQAQRRKDAEAAGGGGGYSKLPSTTETSTRSSAAKKHDTCALQVRLFDGSSIRAKFAADADIATAVRTWVKEASPEGGADIPFTFRQILAPQPSKTIEVGEEHHSLLDLGLVPSATLVLVPIAGATTAYASDSGGLYGAASWVANSAYGVFGELWRFLPSLSRAPAGAPYIGGTADELESSNREGARMAGSDGAAPGGAVRGMRDTRTDDRTTTFYNGNSSAFEGRKDEYAGK